MPDLFDELQRKKQERLRKQREEREKREKAQELPIKIGKGIAIAIIIFALYVVFFLR